MSLNWTRRSQYFVWGDKLIGRYTANDCFEPNDRKVGQGQFSQWVKHKGRILNRPTGFCTLESREVFFKGPGFTMSAFIQMLEIGWNRKPHWCWHRKFDFDRRSQFQVNPKSWNRRNTFWTPFSLPSGMGIGRVEDATVNVLNLRHTVTQSNPKQHKKRSNQKKINVLDHFILILFFSV